MFFLYTNRIKSFLLIFFISSLGVAQDLHWKVSGTKDSGFFVKIFDGDEVLLDGAGEFSLKMSNLDLSVQDEIKDFKAATYEELENEIKLQDDIYLEEFDSNLSIEVTYKKVNSQLIKKTVRLFQPSIPILYYSLIQKNVPAKSPEHYVTFEHEDFPGGLVHELYPSAGFITDKGKVVGFLTDPGYKNHFTRTTRRRFSGRGGGMIGMRVLPDSKLLSIATEEEQKAGDDYIQYTFGNMNVLDRGPVEEYDVTGKLKKNGNIELTRRNETIDIKFKDNSKAGIELITPMRDQKVYTVSFLAKGNVPVSLKLYRLKRGEKTKELEHGIKYIDNFPVDSQKWTEFKGSVLVPYIEGDSISMFLGANNPEKGFLEIKNLKVPENKGFEKSYNKLHLGKSVEKVTYIFSEPWKDQKQFKIST